MCAPFPIFVAIATIDKVSL